MILQFLVEEAWQLSNLNRSLLFLPKTMATFIASDSSPSASPTLSCQSTSTIDPAIAELIEATAQLEIASGSSPSKSVAIEAHAVEEPITASATAEEIEPDLELPHRPDGSIPPAAYCSPGVTLISSTAEIDSIEPWLKRQSRIAVDAEGVNLSRVGSLTVLSLAVELPEATTAGGAIPAHVFLFDMMHSNAPLLRRQTSLLKDVLEHPAIEIIIHDCRQDSDALKVHFNISLTSVFDTSFVMAFVAGETKRSNLNDALRSHDLPINYLRSADKTMYDINPSFWATRPMTSKMIDYAAGDVATLFQLRRKILARLEEKRTFLQRMHGYDWEKKLNLEMQQSVDDFRGRSFSKIVTVPKRHFGKIIGKGGSTIRSLETRFDVMISSSTSDGFLILAASQANIQRVEAEMRNLCQQAERSNNRFYCYDY